MTKKRWHFSLSREQGSELELAVLNLEDQGARCLRLDDGAIVLYRGKDQLEAVPGTVVTVKVKDTGTKAGLRFVSGKLTGARVDVARLGRPPLALDQRAAADLDRKAFSFERVARRLPTGEDPMELIAGADPELGDPERLALAMLTLTLDVRSIEAHGVLGNLLFNERPEAARIHYEVGASIGEYALGPGFEGCVPWRFYENQAFLHCLRQMALCDLARGDLGAARPILERAVVLDPDDGHQAGKVLAQVRTGKLPDLDDDEVEAEQDEDRVRAPVREGAKPVELSAIVDAMESSSPGFEWYVDLETGDVIPVQDGGDDDLLPVPLDELQESDRFVLVEPVPTHDAYEDMKDFAEGAADGRLRGKLLAALEGKGAFRRFKDALLDHPAARAQFFAFKDERVSARARRWLEDEGIPYVEKKPAKG